MVVGQKEEVAVIKDRLHITEEEKEEEEEEGEEEEEEEEERNE